jgi:hypothetical protein
MATDDPNPDRPRADIPDASPWNDLIGPFYDSAGLIRWTKTTQQDLHADTARGNILGVRTEDGDLLYPAWQFGNDGAPTPGLAEVLATLRTTMPDPWANALWLNAPVERFGGKTAVQMLWAGEPGPVLAAARHDAGMLAS